MKYIIKTQNVPDWEKTETAFISNYVWGGEYRSEAWGKLINLGGEGLAAKLWCREENPKAVYRNFFDPVYLDSCLEFFFSAEKGGIYLNCEMNSAGAALMEIGTSRRDRTPLDKIAIPPKVKAEKSGGVWSAEVYFPLELLKKVFGDISLSPGAVLYGNFYKCGDKTPNPHYGMWSPVKTPTPDFHRPEYFGILMVQ